MNQVRADEKEVQIVDGTDATRGGPPNSLNILPNVVEDPVADFLNRNWKNLTIVLVAIAAIVYARSQFIDTANARLSEASGFYSRAVQTIAAIGQGKATEEQKKALPDLLKALGESQAPYSEVAGSLTTLKKITEGDLVAAEAQISVPLPALDENSKQHLSRLAAEVTTMAAARALLTSDAKRNLGIDSLVALVNTGEFVPASALSVLQSVAPGRVVSDNLVASLAARKPYSSTILKES